MSIREEEQELNAKGWRSLTSVWQGHSGRLKDITTHSPSHWVRRGGHGVLEDIARRRQVQASLDARMR